MMFNFLNFIITLPFSIPAKESTSRGSRNTISYITLDEDGMQQCETYFIRSFNQIPPKPIMFSRQYNKSFSNYSSRFMNTCFRDLSATNPHNSFKFSDVRMYSCDDIEGYGSIKFGMSKATEDYELS